MTKFREFFGPKLVTRRRLVMGGVAAIVGFVVLGILTIPVWDYSNSVAFCSDTCHNVHPEETEAFQDSYHARVKCTECHMGRVNALEGMVLKAGHFKHGVSILLGTYDRPLESETMRPANESCERCHWPPAFHGDTVREIKRYEADEDNTEKRTYLILKTGGGERLRGLGYGIHWHIENKVEFIAADERKQDIRWVRTTLPNGRTVEYHNIVNPMTSEELDEAEIHVMECADCHNRVGHPFPAPEQAADEAIADGRLNRDLPFAKKEMLDLLNASYPNQAAALAAVETVKIRYEATYPEIAVTYANEIEQAAETARQLLKRLVFERPGTTWQDFPNESEHKYFDGCFRCHDGNHINAQGQSIRLHCNICHSIPLTVGEGDRPPEMPIVSIPEPVSHLETNFMADHRFQANGACEICHGELQFGADDSSFCANSACHGQAWPEVNLDAAFPHPLKLEGKHAEAWCHDCHVGERKPVYKCVNCHQPPSPSHFNQTCENCHTPEGFKPANLAGFKHRVPLEGKHAEVECLACHTAGLKLVYECTICHLPPENHAQTMCEGCHSPQGWVESVASIIAQSPPVPHDTEKLNTCLLCHDPGGKAIPAPAQHVNRTNEQCIFCHKAE